MTAAGNLFAGLPAVALADEVTEVLARSGAVRIERIVSTGQASPPGQWYDQGWDEWVTVLRGAADLLIEGEAAPRRLGPGDWVFLPARCRHRVVGTAPGAATVWIAVHMPAGGRGDDGAAAED